MADTAGDELVLDLEPRVRALGGTVKHHQVEEDRVELGEGTVNFLSELLGALAGVKQGVPQGWS